MNTTFIVLGLVVSQLVAWAQTNIPPAIQASPATNQPPATVPFIFLVTAPTPLREQPVRSCSSPAQYTGRYETPSSWSTGFGGRWYQGWGPRYGYGENGGRFLLPNREQTLIAPSFHSPGPSYGRGENGGEFLLPNRGQGVTPPSYAPGPLSYGHNAYGAPVLRGNR